MKIVDLFCGCGGLSLGFQRAGYKILAAFDNWDDAITVYHNNFSHPVIKQDLSDTGGAIERIARYNPDMIVGGPPCQDFSSAGNRDENKGRGDLTVHFATIVSTIKPRWFVMENVDMITKTDKLVEARRRFKETGYGLTQMVLNASRCGVPQRRKRFFLIGCLGEKDGFMEDVLLKRQTTKDMTLRDCFGDRLGVHFYYRHPRSYARRGIFSIDEPSPTIRGVNRPIPANYKLHRNDPVDSLEGIRPLTTKERSLIQTFPESFKFVGTKTDMEQMIGNAVPVNLAKYVGDSIMSYLGEENSVDCSIIREEYPNDIIKHNNSINEVAHGLDKNNSLLVSLVKKENVDLFLDGSARIYYTGKKFPSTIALNKLYYFMPYVKRKGIRDLYLIKIARVGTKKEVHPECDDNDFRLVFEIEFVKQLFDDYKPHRLKIWETFTDTTLEELIQSMK